MKRKRKAISNPDALSDNEERPCKKSTGEVKGRKSGLRLQAGQCEEDKGDVRLNNQARRQASARAGWKMQGTMPEWDTVQLRRLCKSHALVLPACYCPVEHESSRQVRF